jgi:hypothetical protein
MSTKRRRRLVVEGLEERALLSAMTVVEHEPNNRAVTANRFVLASGTTTELVGSAARADKDAFVFTAPGNGTIAVTGAAVAGASDVVTIIDHSGRVLAQTKPGVGRVTVQVSVKGGAAYYISVHSAARIAATDYIVSVDFAPRLPTGGGGVFPAKPPNGTPSQATPFTIGVGKPAKLTGTSQNRSNLNYFVFTAPTSGTLAVTLSTPSGPLPFLQVLDVSQNPLTTLDNGRANGTASVSGSAIYYVLIKASFNAPAPYVVNLGLF